MVKKMYVCVLSNDGDRMNIHRADCRDLVNEENFSDFFNPAFPLRAENGAEALKAARQAAFKKAGGKGNFEDANKSDYARSFANRRYHVMTCAR